MVLVNMGLVTTQVVIVVMVKGGLHKNPGIRMVTGIKVNNPGISLHSNKYFMTHEKT